MTKPNPNARLKQYVATRDFDPSGIKGSWSKGDLIRVNPDNVRPYIANGTLIPLAVAVQTNLYPPKKDTLVDKLRNLTQDRSTGSTELSNTEEAKISGKQLISNRLQEAVLKKKEELTQNDSDKPSISADKLAAIKAGGQ
jgi:hypothetical protein